jgi:hypothetical protein
VKVENIYVSYIRPINDKERRKEGSRERPGRWENSYQFIF